MHENDFQIKNFMHLSKDLSDPPDSRKSKSKTIRIAVDGLINHFQCVCVCGGEGWEVDPGQFTKNSLLSKLTFWNFVFNYLHILFSFFLSHLSVSARTDFVVCREECIGDCPDGQTCWFNGCGHVCIGEKPGEN